MSALQNWLKRPYPYEEKFMNHVLNAQAAGMIVLFFLFLFRPFGMYSSDVWLLFKVCAGFGLVTFVMYMVGYFIMRMIPNFGGEERWTIQREIIANILVISLISLGNMLFTNLFLSGSFGVKTYLSWVGMTMLVGIVPAMASIIIKERRLLKKHSQEAAKLQAQLVASTHEHPGELEISLEGDTQQDKLKLKPSELVYISSADNYIRVYYRKGTNIENTMLRMSMKKAEDALSNFTYIVRCHRTFLVNLDEVAQVSGNAQGYRLHLRDSQVEIPVSRSMNQFVRERVGKGGID